MDELDVETLDAFFDSLQKTGLFFPLNETQSNKQYADFKAQTSQLSVHHFMFGMAGVIYMFDSAFWGIRPIEDSYIKLFSEISKMTRGVFNPTAVSFQRVSSSENQEAAIDCLFQLNGRFFQTQLVLLGDMVDLALISFINQSVAQAGESGRFYWVETHDQIIAICFLTPEQYAIIKPRYNEHITPFEDHL